jgi:DNA polymerase III sliding clamp (beta) subunit (PCNA family)
MLKVAVKNGDLKSAFAQLKYQPGSFSALKVMAIPDHLVFARTVEGGISTIWVKMDADCDGGPEEVLVGGGILENLTGLTENDVIVTLTFSDDGTYLEAVCPIYKYVLKNLPSEDFYTTVGNYDSATVFEDVNFPLSVNTQTLCHLEGIIAKAKERSTSRPGVMHGIYFHLDKDSKLEMAATDKYRVAWLDPVNGVVSENSNEHELVVTSDFFDVLRKAGSDEADVVIEERHIAFRTENIVFASGLMSGNFPGFKSVIGNRNREKDITADSREMSDAIQRLLSLWDDSVRSCEITLGEEASKISLTSKILGEAVEEISSMKSELDWEQNFNPKYLLDAVTLTGEDTNLTVDLGETPTHPVVFHYENTPGVHYLVAPVRKS